MALPPGVALGWAVKGYPVWAAAALLLVPVLLAVGDKFELDATRWRYRDGYHWAHWLNPSRQRLPPVQGVVMKPHAY